MIAADVWWIAETLEACFYRGTIFIIFFDELHWHNWSKLPATVLCTAVWNIHPENILSSISAQVDVNDAGMGSQNNFLWSLQFKMLLQFPNSTWEEAGCETISRMEHCGDLAISSFVLLFSLFPFNLPAQYLKWFMDVIKFYDYNFMILCE